MWWRCKVTQWNRKKIERWSKKVKSKTIFKNKGNNLVVPSWTEIVRETTCTYGGKETRRISTCSACRHRKKFRMVIRYVDVIGVQSNAMEKGENRTVKAKRWKVKQSQIGNNLVVPSWTEIVKEATKSAGKIETRGCFSGWWNGLPCWTSDEWTARGWLQKVHVPSVAIPSSFSSFLV